MTHRGQEWTSGGEGWDKGCARLCTIARHTTVTRCEQNGDTTGAKLHARIAEWTRWDFCITHESKTGRKKSRTRQWVGESPVPQVRNSWSQPEVASPDLWGILSCRENRQGCLWSAIRQRSCWLVLRQRHQQYIACQGSTAKSLLKKGLNTISKKTYRLITWRGARWNLPSINGFNRETGCRRKILAELLKEYLVTRICVNLDTAGGIKKDAPWDPPVAQIADRIQQRQSD